MDKKPWYRAAWIFGGAAASLIIYGVVSGETTGRSPSQCPPSELWHDSLCIFDMTISILCWTVGSSIKAK
jgi:hypothetical protein